jgi:precorrin-6B methylase 2
MITSYDISDKYGMMSHEEIDLLKQCVALLPARPVVVVIGANAGTATCAIFEANPAAFIFSIDVHPCVEERASLIVCGLPYLRVVRILGKSQDVGVAFPYAVDMVVVDGAHEPEAVTEDIRVWKPRALTAMTFHDFGHPNYNDDAGFNFMTHIVNNAMQDWERVGQARYLVGFKR